MILHHYTHGDELIASYYGYGFGSIFAKLFSKVAAKTTSRAALGDAKRIGSKLVRDGVRKISPVAKKTITSAVKKGMKKAVPVAKNMVKKGVKRAAEEAQSAIANKVRKMEKSAIKRGVSPQLAHKVSTILESGSREGINRLENLVNEKGDKAIAEILKESGASKTTHSKKSKEKVGNPLQNLIDSA